MDETAALLAASEAGDIERVRQLLGNGCPAYAQEDEHGRSALMLAAAAGHETIVKLLLSAGAPWNAVDRRGQAAGNYALNAGNQNIVDLLVDEAVRAELILGAAERRTLRAKENVDYLSRGVKYDGERLIDADDDAVMMQWEAPLMELHAERLCAAGGDVLNVGFGLGIIDSAIARHSPRSHTIVEAHPDVYARMQRDGWTTRPGVRVLFGRWQDVLPRLEGPCFDAIYFDTYGEYDADMAAFHDDLPRLLREGGVYSFFNGMCPFNVFFQGVACAVMQLELQALGLRCSFEPVEVSVPPQADEQWAHIKRRYFFSDTYYMPHCVLCASSDAPDPPPALSPAHSAAADSSESAAAHFARLNVSLVRLLARTLQPSSAAAADAASAHGLRTLLESEVLPHLEAAGWRLLSPLSSLWKAIDNGADVRGSASIEISPLDLQALDQNSAELLRGVIAMASDPSAPRDEIEQLQLAIVPNPLGAAAPVPPEPDAGGPTDAGAGAEGATLPPTTSPPTTSPPTTSPPSTYPLGGRDGGGVAFASPEDFWQSEVGGDSASWYQRSSRFWREEGASVRGMLGGLDQLHAPDVRASKAFVDALRALTPALPQGVALDCGAGIGRVSASVLLDRFEAVELLEPIGAFVDKARETLPAHRVRAVHQLGLERFHPPPGSCYACVWVQWVLNYLTDRDLVAFLRRCAGELKPAGCIVVKESHSREQNGLETVLDYIQPEMPNEMFPVRMWALRPAGDAR